MHLLKELKDTGIAKENVSKYFDYSKEINEGLSGFYDNFENNEKVVKDNKFVSFSEFNKQLYEEQMRKTLKMAQQLNQVELITAVTKQCAEYTTPESMNKDFQINEIIQGVKDFQKKGNKQIREEIKDFIEKYKIRHVIIADMTTVPPERISGYLRSDQSYLSAKSKLKIYTWYVTCLKHPELLTEFYPQMTKESLTLINAVNLIPTKKHRFVFRREQLLILNKQFQINPYPTRERIKSLAEECNLAYEAIVDIPLFCGEKVNQYMIRNWFYNKRKRILEKERKIKKKTGLRHKVD